MCYDIPICSFLQFHSSVYAMKKLPILYLYVLVSKKKENAVLFCCNNQEVSFPKFFGHY